MLKRVRKVCQWLIFQDLALNDADIADKMGYTRSSFSQIINGKVPVSEKFISKLCLFDKNINKVWVMDGIGDMFLNQDSTLIREPNALYGDNNEKTVIALLNEISQLKDTIIKLQAEQNAIKSHRPKTAKL
ncbi:MAG: helix-turn-helix transcriptional regulator [Edaphocola sp.]